ncbi:MAG: GNVR domain-containing protein, partial [Acidobacteriaceae bacterium]
TGLIQLDSQARALIESAASLRAQIAAKEVQIQAMQTYATGENAQLVEAQQELDGLRTQLARLGGSEEGPNSLLVPKGKVPEAGLEYVRRLRDVKYYETIFDILARQFEVAKLDQAKEGALVQVVDPAIVPDRKSSPKRTIIVVVSTVAGFFLGILVALFQMAWARLKSDPEHGPKVALLWRALRGGPGATP